MKWRNPVLGVSVDAQTGEVAYAEGCEWDGYLLDWVVDGIKLRADAGVPLPSAYKNVAPYKRLRVALAGSGNTLPLQISVPPLLIDGVPYIYARCAAAMLGRNVISESRDRVVIGGSQPFEIKLRRSWWPGHPMKVIFDRLYLPLDTVNRLFGCQINWIRSDNTLFFPALPEAYEYHRQSQPSNGYIKERPRIDPGAG